MKNIYKDLIVGNNFATMGNNSGMGSYDTNDDVQVVDTFEKADRIASVLYEAENENLDFQDFNPVSGIRAPNFSYGS